MSSWLEYARHVPWPLVAALFLGLALGVWLTRALARRAARRDGHAARTIGSEGERAAERWLREQGYAIVSRQPELHVDLMINGSLTSCRVTPDFLVERGGERLVVEVKLRKAGQGLAAAPIRRQLLEYALASGCPCMLVNVARGEVEFLDLPLNWDLPEDERIP